MPDRSNEGALQQWKSLLDSHLELAIQDWKAVPFWTQQYRERAISSQETLWGSSILCGMER
jgi:hypothetical protein